jgi:PhnB protein
MRVEPYLFFDGRCDEAIEFYSRAIGAKVSALVRFKDSPATPAPPGARDKVMHASLRIGNSTVLASDGQARGAPSFAGFSLSLTAPNDEVAERAFARLSEGGRVQVPLAPTAFASRFGMVTDRFGVLWTIATPAPEAQPAPR